MRLILLWVILCVNCPSFSNAQAKIVITKCQSSETTDRAFFYKKINSCKDLKEAGDTMKPYFILANGDYFQIMCLTGCKPPLVSEYGAPKPVISVPNKFKPLETTMNQKRIGLYFLLNEEDSLSELIAKRIQLNITEKILDNPDIQIIEDLPMSINSELSLHQERDDIFNQMRRRYDLTYFGIIDLKDVRPYSQRSLGFGISGYIIDKPLNYTLSVIDLKDKVFKLSMSKKIKMANKFSKNNDLYAKNIIDSTAADAIKELYSFLSPNMPDDSTFFNLIDIKVIGDLKVKNSVKTMLERIPSVEKATLIDGGFCLQYYCDQKCLLGLLKEDEFMKQFNPEISEDYIIFHLK